LTDVSRYTVTEIPCHEIFCDNDFNCRKRIDRTTCVELALDIKERGLDFPIHVQPYELKLGFKYRIICGHRRFIAVSVINKEATVPCVVRTDLGDEKKARETNLRENIQRQELTLLQEAEAISYFVLAGDSVGQIAKRLGKTTGWVEPRRKLMALPKFVRDAADQGIVTQSHINQMWSYRDDNEKLSAMIREIKERTDKGERSIVIKEERKITDFAAVRCPKHHEIDDFLEVLAKNIVQKLPEEIDEYFAARCLAWVRGHISQAQLYLSLRKECTRLNLEFRPPEDIRKIMESVVKA
jgi:ParB/RepB/Spo0J family partition protein